MNEYRLIFDYLQSKELVLDNLHEIVHSLKPEEIYLIVNELLEYTNFDNLNAGSYFSFMPNSRLSGGSYLDSSIDTRLKQSNELIRDSLLFADVIWIKNPIDPYFHCSEGYFCSEDSRDELIEDLMILYQYRELLENGFARICATESHFCHDCLMSSVAYDDVPERYRKSVNKIEKTICKEFIDSVKFKAHRQDEHLTLYLESLSDDLLEKSKNEIRLTEFGFGPVLEKAAKRKSGKVFKKEVQDSMTLYCELIRPIIDDVLMYNWYSSQENNRLSYLTNRRVDARSMELASSKRTRSKNIGITSALSHSIPQLMNVPIDRLIALRKNEGESFENYRFHMDQVLEDVHSKSIDSKNIQEAMSDLVMPHINQMNATVVKNKKNAGKGLLTNVVVGGGSVILGLIDNFLPMGMSGPLMALAASNHGPQAIQNLRTLLSNGNDARDQNFYFLWRSAKK